jgi:hypothetical protein
MASNKEANEHYAEYYLGRLSCILCCKVRQCKSKVKHSGSAIQYCLVCFSLSYIFCIYKQKILYSDYFGPVSYFNYTE